MLMQSLLGIFQKLPSKTCRLSLPSWNTLPILPQQGVLVSELQAECKDWNDSFMGKCQPPPLAKVFLGKIAPCSSKWPKLRFLFDREAWFCSHKNCVWTQNMQHITVSIFHQKKTHKEEKQTLVLYSTYLFIPCPQSNPKKCYAKELKENKQTNKQNRN